MNHTHVALLAFLLPFSGLGITKEERKREINEEARELVWSGVYDLMYFICTYSKCIDLSSLSQEDRELFLKKMEELRTNMEKLGKEYSELEKS